MRRHRIALVTAGLVLSVVAATAVVQVTPRNASRMAYVSLQRIGSQSTSAQASAKKLEARRGELARAIGEKQKRLEGLRLQLAQSGGIFKSSKRQALVVEADRTRAELQKLRDDSQREIQGLQHQLQADFRKDLAAILVDLARQRGFDMVLNEDSAVVWSVPGSDLTEEAVKRLNAKN